MIGRLIDDVKYWRHRSDEARALAEKMTSPDFKRIVYDIAETYQRMAQCAEERARRRDRSRLSAYAEQAP
jgi:hypothetical protein